MVIFMTKYALLLVVFAGFSSAYWNFTLLASHASVNPSIGPKARVLGNLSVVCGLFSQHGIQIFQWNETSKAVGQLKLSFVPANTTQSIVPQFELLQDPMSQKTYLFYAADSVSESGLYVFRISDVWFNTTSTKQPTFYSTYRARSVDIDYGHSLLVTAGPLDVILWNIQDPECPFLSADLILSVYLGRHWLLIRHTVRV